MRCVLDPSDARTVSDTPVATSVRFFEALESCVGRAYCDLGSPYNFQLEIERLEPCFQWETQQLAPEKKGAFYCRRSVRRLPVS